MITFSMSRPIIAALVISFNLWLNYAGRDDAISWAVRQANSYKYSQIRLIWLSIFGNEIKSDFDRLDER